MFYYYGMKNRGCSPGAQPQGGFVHFVDTEKNSTGYYSIVVYNRKLSVNECFDYDLVTLTEEKAKALMFKDKETAIEQER